MLLGGRPHLRNRNLRRAVRLRHQPAVLPRQRRRPHQLLHVRLFLRHVPAGLHRPDTAQDRLRPARARRLHGVPAHVGDPAPAGPPLLPSWAVWCTPVAVARVWLRQCACRDGKPGTTRAEEAGRCEPDIPVPALRRRSLLGVRRAEPPGLAGFHTQNPQVWPALARRTPRSGRLLPAEPPGLPVQRVRSIRVLPRVLGLTRSRSRNSATPSSYERSSSA
jgi:hypothetical protein